ncbi:MULTISPECIES: hypothetical protein [Coprobacillaceae]|uniref:hypothetical protein n=1 Tax=Coprobacillaceae TaxID=2810280 RepID=UPI000E4F8D48|nr:MULTISPECIES: hypothetical protein [Coprobacillaceae]RHM61479.1 hypothetical protein DWZ53_04820 [Coprobacillus sp. AF33-1AC]RHS93976.1 hypothetical protein DW911_05415 [Erysipelatoclostridium sp. AM42-17]
MGEYNEEEMLYLSRLGSQSANDLFHDEYYKKIKYLIQFTYYYSSNQSEWIQEVMMSLDKACLNFRDDRQTLMKTYFQMIIKDSVKSLYYYDRKERCVLSRTLSLNQSYHDSDCCFGEVVGDQSDYYQPARQLLLKDQMTQYNRTIDPRLSQLEKEVYQYLMVGYNHQDISLLLDINVRASYNACYRLRRKIKRIQR